MPDTVVAASLTLDSKQADQSVASFKAELKKAQQEVINLTDKFGATSKAATDAAKRAAELKDRIGDAKKLVDSFNPDEKFRGFTQVLTGVAGGFSAITGAMGLLGVQSEDVQKQLLKVQSALAITQGLNSIGDSIQSFKNLGATLVNTLGKGGLIGIAIVGVTALGAAFLGLFDNAKKATESQKALADSTKDYAKAASTAIEEVTKVGTAFELARSGVISKEAALKTYNDTLGDSFGKTNDLATAEKNLADKADEYIKITGLKAQANALFAKSAELMAQSTIEQKELEKEFAESVAGSAEFLRPVLQKAKEDGDKQIADRKQQAKEIQDLGAGLLREAETISKSAGIISKVQNEVNEAAAKAAKEREAKLLEEAKKDAAIRTQLAAGKITGRVGDLEIPKSPEQLQFELEAQQRHDIRVQEEADLGRNIGYKKTISDYNIKLSNEQIEQDQLQYDRKKAIAGATVDLLNSVADLFGRQTATGKALGVATATINTLIGITEVFRAKSVLPEPIGTIVKIASAAALAANGFATVKKILAVNVPGNGGGGAGVPSFSAQAPLEPQAQVQTTRLDQQSLNNTNNATVQAYVVESQGADAKERISRLNRAARLGG